MKKLHESFTRSMVRYAKVSEAHIERVGSLRDGFFINSKSSILWKK